MSERVSSIREEAEGRRVAYALFGRLFLCELGIEEITSLSRGEGMRALRSLSDAGIASNSADRIIAAASRGDEQAVERLSVEYSRLFNAHDRIYSHASCWLCERPRLMGEPWQEVLDLYHREGLAPQQENVWSADHVGTELYFASVLSGRAAGAQSVREAHAAHEVFVDYVKNHVMTWVPRFFDKVAADQRADFYADAAIVGLDYLDVDARMLGITLDQAAGEGLAEEVRR